MPAKKGGRNTPSKRNTRSKAKGTGPGNSAKAGTVFPVGRLARMIRRTHARRSGYSAGVFMAAALEYVCAEVLELAGDHCVKAGRKTIAPKHINLAVRSDAELSKLIAHATMFQGGVTQHVDPRLLPKKKGKAAGEDATQPL